MDGTFDLDNEVAKAMATIEKYEVSEGTWHAYKAEWRIFAEWGLSMEVETLPASPGVVQAYMVEVTGAALDDDGVLVLANRASRVDKVIASIRWQHRRAKHPTPTSDPGVRALRDLLFRAEQPDARQAPALRLAQVEAVAADPAGRRSLRDLVLVVLGFFGAFRGCELVAIRVEHLSWFAEGVVVFVPRSKGDPLGRGEYVAIAARPDSAVCPVALLREYLTETGITKGWLFPSPNVRRVGEHIATSTLSEAIKRVTANVLPDGVSHYTTHSLRRGFCTSAAEAGQSLLLISRKARHRSLATTIPYIDRGAAAEAADIVVQALEDL